MRESTVGQPVECEGTGLHSGKPARLRIEPADAACGLVFYAEGSPVAIPARLASVTSATRATVLRGESPGGAIASIATVEHLLATLSAFSIQHACIHVSGPELPALDGSALPFAGLLAEAGRHPLGGELSPLELTAPIEIREGDRFVRAEPADHFGVVVRIDFDHPAIGEQSIRLPEIDRSVFERELAPARTFGFFEEVEALREAGRALGANLDNTVVLDGDGVMNPNGLRFEDEFVRHKALDLVGDLALLERPLRARVIAQRAGHRLHHQLVRAIEEAVDAAGEKR